MKAWYCSVATVLKYVRKVATLTHIPTLPSHFRSLRQPPSNVLRISNNERNDNLIHNLESLREGSKTVHNDFEDVKEISFLLLLTLSIPSSSWFGSITFFGSSNQG
jgi:hypothetical protein